MKELHALPGDDQPVPVDPPSQPVTIYATALAARTADRRPIIPAWARNRGEARDLAVWLGRYGAHVTAYHLTRLPKYAAKLTLRAPLGLLTALVRTLGWVFDREAAPLRMGAVARNSVEDYMKLSKQRNARVRQRGILAVAGVVALAVTVALVAMFGPPWLQWAVVLAAVGVLGKLGTPDDRRVTDPAVVSNSAPPRLTADVVTRALSALGISGMTAKGAEITFPAPITRDGPGWRADVDLPYGVTPGQVMDRRNELASGLRRPLGCVWPGPARDQHEGRLVLWVGDQDLAKAKQPAWPLARSGRTNLFEPVAFGTDQRGRTVPVTLMFASAVIGSIPRMGKTFSLRLLLLAAALDPIAELHLFDLKGTGDLSAVAPVAHAYRAGDDVDDIDYALADMRALHADLRRRTKTIRELPRSLAPENKVTRDLAEKRSLGLWPVVLGVDECQRWFEHAEHGKELTAIAEDLVRRGPAAGITAIFATQRPDAKSIPTGISGNAILRFCLKVMDHVANDQVLGTSAHRNGIKATVFSRKDLGIGWLSGEDDDPQITRTFYVDGPGAEAIVTRARAARENAGTLTGYAVDETPPAVEAPDLLADVRAVLAAAGTDRIWHDDLVALLAELRPAVYGDWDARRLGTELRARGVPTRQIALQVDGERVNRNGTRADDVAKVLTAGPERPELTK